LRLSVSLVGKERCCFDLAILTSENVTFSYDNFGIFF
jgi:hypothetical protein